MLGAQLNIGSPDACAKSVIDQYKTFFDTD